MKQIMTPRCKKCGERPLIIHTAEALPTMVGFQLKNGKVINICKSCLIDLGNAQESGDTKEWDDFFAQF